MEQHKVLSVSTNGFHNMAYTVWGHNDNIPLVCVHGLTRSGRDFDALAATLSSQGRQVICPDIVGRGESDWLTNPANYNFPQYICDITALFASRNISQVDWLGTSMGGLIGMFIAAMQNSPVRRLILNDIGPYITGIALKGLANYVGTNPTFTNINDAETYFRKIYAGFGNLTDQQWQNMTINSVKKISNDRYVQKIDPAITLERPKYEKILQMLLHPLKSIDGTVFDINFWPTWKAITCPVLVIRGEHSTMLLPSVVEKMQALHAQTDVITIPNAGHAPGLMDQAQINYISAWLQEN